MPVIPFSSAARLTEIDRETQEQRDAEEARRYREQADAKLKELMNTPVKRFDPSPIDVPEPVTGGWRVRTNGDPQPNGDALPGGAFNRMGAPDINDPMRDEQGFGGPDNWTPELAMPASPEGESFVGMGSGGPEQPVGDGGLSEEQIASIRDRFRKRKEGESTRDLRARMLNAPNADQAAIDADLAERQGVNRLEVERNRDTFVAVDRAQAIDRLRTSAPKLRAWLDYNPANLEVAHDDVENLGWWEQTQAFFSPGNLSLEKVGQALQSGFVDKIPEQLYGLDQMLGDANASIYKALPDWFPGKFGLVNEQVQRSLMADMKRQEMAAQGKANAPVGETWLERGIYGAAQSAPSTITSVIITAITKSPVVGGGSMGATTAGGAYGEARDEGKSLGDAFRYALTQGGIETATEFIPLKFLVDDLAKDSSFAKTFFRQAAAEGISEQAATFLQDASTFIEMNPDKTLGEFLAERPNAALETLVASTIMSGVTTTVAQGMQAAGDQIDKNAREKRTEQLSKTFDAMAQNSKDSKLLKRLPEKYRELVNQVTKDGPLESVRIAPEAITSLAQEKGVSVEQIAQAFRIDPNEMVTAIDTGEDVVIPAGNYAAGLSTSMKEIGVSGETIHQALAADMRLRADDFTARESEAAKAAFEAEATAREDRRETDQAFADSGDRVRNTIREQVSATGRFNADSANTQAELVGSMVETLALRTGVDPEALWKEQGFDIVASLSGEQPEAGALPQSIGEDATPTQRLIDMRAKGSSNAEIATALYPDADAKTATNRVKALASKHKAKIEERRAELEGAKSLAQFGGVHGANWLKIEGEPRVVDALGLAMRMDTEGATREEIWAATTDMLRGTNFIGAFKGVDNLWRFEVDDSDVVLKKGRPITGTLADFLTNADVGGAYPGVAETPTTAKFSLFTDRGKYGKGGISAKSDDLRSVLLHEAQHAIQEEELFAMGANSKDPNYRRHAGEVEARNVQSRRNFTADERRAKPPWTTEDTPADQQIVVLAGSQARLLAQETRGDFTPRADRNVVRLFESANLSTLAHEGSHWYLDTLWRMSKTENPHPFVLEQLAAVLEWHGKSPNWDAMFNPDGSFTKEGVELQEAFAETFEAYLMDGKAPTTALRSVFASFKQWLLSIYKGLVSRIGGRANLNDEIRQVFDRMLATDEAIKAVHVGIARDGEAMAQAILKAQDPKGLWKPERKEKFLERMRERYAAARERAEAALMARLMDEYQRTQKSAWTDEEREVRLEVQSEIDERPEQRAYFWLSTGQYRDTREAQAEEAAAEADAMRSLAQTRVRLADVDLGLTERQQAMVNPIYRPEVLPASAMPTNLEAARWLESMFPGSPIYDLTATLTPEQITEIATVMAAEVQLGLGNTGNAASWYSTSLSTAFQTIALKYPMLMDDAAAKAAGFGKASNTRFVFTYIMAVTSQNLDVTANSVATDKAFAEMLQRVAAGDYTMSQNWGTGDKKKAMNANFAKFGPLIEAMGTSDNLDFPARIELLDDMFRKQQTVSEWVADMKDQGIPFNKPGQTAMDAVVYGSSLLGPKIGNGFWQNLNGNYSPLTIDLWKRRTWGRLTGYSIGNPDALPAQRKRLADAVARSRSAQRGKDDVILAHETRLANLNEQQEALKPGDFANKKAFGEAYKALSREIDATTEALADYANIKAPEKWSASYNKNDEELLAYTKRALAVWQREYKELAAKYADAGGVTADMVPTWVRAAKTIITNMAKPLDQVANGTQRIQIERAVAEAKGMLAARGFNLTTADMQAILWYPEKELWGALTSEMATDEDGVPVVEMNPLNLSYDEAFREILKGQGYAVQGTQGTASGSAGAGTVAGSNGGPQGSQGSGGAGQAGAKVRGGTPGAGSQGQTSLAQSQTHDPKGERELDALGFYSAVFEAAKSVRPDVWSMGWDHARNSIVKGGAKINGQRVAPRETEMAFLGLDAMFYGTKLKGAELAEAVLDHIQAKRLLLVENFVRIDYNAKAPPKAVMLDEIDDDTLSSMIGLHTPSSGRVLATELDGSNEFQTGLFMSANGERTQYDVPKLDLFRVLDGGKREVLGSGVSGDLAGIAARIIVNENRNLVMRKISAETMQEHWRESIGVEADRTLVRGPGDIRLPGEDVPLFEAVIGLPEGVPGSDYRAPGSHVGGKAKGTLVTAHGEERIDDKGQRTVFVGQVQSDMAQQAREDKADAPHHLAVIKLLSENPDAQWFGIDAQGEYRPPLESDSQRDLIARGTLERGVADFSRVADIPLLSTSEWTNVAVRSMLYRAARDGFQSISFPTAETSEIIQGNDTAAMHYETNVKGALEKLAKQLGGEVRLGAVKYDQDEGGQDDPKLAILSLADGSEASREELVLNIHLDYGINVGTASRMVSDALNGDVSWWTTSDRPQKTIEAAQYLDGLEDTGQFVQDLDFGRADAYILDITPAMRAKILSEGFPLFQTKTGKGTTTPPADLPLMRLNLQAVREQYGEQALAEIPPEVAAFSATANDVDMYLATVREIRKTLNETPPKSLWKFLSTPRNIGQGEGRISYRGIRDTDGEILKIIGEKKAARGLIADPTKDSKRSRSYDMQQAIEAAWEAGYFDGEELPTPAQFLDTLRADIDGQAPRYRRDDIPTVSMIANAERWEAWFDQNDINIHEKDVSVLRAKLAVMLTGQGENAIGPDEAAPFFKLPNGRALLDGLKQGPLRDKLIREETRRRMIERNGDVFRDGTIMAKAEEYARNELQHRQWEIELEALAEAGGQRIATNALKQQAIENLRSKQVREVLNYNQYLTLERRWSEKAIKEKDPAKAAEYAKYRLLNSYMYSEGKKLAEQIEKTRKHLLAYESKSKLARLFSAGKEYAENMRGLLSDYQLRNESRKAENQRQARSAWIQTQMAGIDPFAAYADPTLSVEQQQIAAAEAIERSSVLARLSDGVDAQNYKSITVQELLAVRDEADLIWRLATLKDRLIKDGERRKLSLAAEDIAEEIEANQPNDKGPEPLETDTPGEKVKTSIQMYFAMHRTLQSLAHQFAGGKEGGVFWRYIVRPLNEAFGKLTTIRKQMGEDVAGLFGVYTTAEQERFYRDRRQFAGIGRSLTTQGRLAIALNWGNEKNRKRIMDAYGWDEAQVQEVLDSLEKRDWDWVQSVWDYMDTWFPEANRVHEAVHAAPMDKVEPLQVATRFGVYRGGYYPIKYDPRTSSKSGQRAMEADAKRQTGGIGTRTQPGFGKKRVEGKVTLPLRLSALDVITQHLDEVAKSIATEETLFDIGRILKQPAVEEAIISRHGRQIYNQVVNQIITAKFGMDGTSGLLAHLRNGATVVGLSWKVATASLQILGASNSIVRVGGPWVAMGYAKTAGGGVPLYTAARDAMRKSEFMRNRRQNQSPEMASLLDAMKSKWTPDFIARFIPRELRAMHNFMVRNGFALMSNVQFASVDVPTWWGAYFKAQSTGASEEDAVAMADQAVVDAQGGGEIYQLAAMQSGAGVKYGALLRILTNFMSYMVTTYNLGIQRVRNARTMGQIMALGFDMIILAAVPVAGKMALDLITKGVGEDDEPEEWAEKYAREQIAFLFGPFVGISQFAGSARGDDSYGYKGPAGLMFFDVMNELGSAVAEGKIIDEEEGGLDKNFWRPANRALGIVLHYPASQVDASIRGAQAYFNGETDNPAAIFFGPPPAN